MGYKSDPLTCLLDAASDIDLTEGDDLEETNDGRSGKRKSQGCDLATSPSPKRKNQVDFAPFSP